MSNQEAALSSGRCPHCNGKGWVITVENRMGYGPAEFAGRCPYCSGQRRAIEEDTGIPGKFCETDYSKFSWNAYSRSLAKIKQITDNFVFQYQTWEHMGKGLYLWSKTPGSGKTFLASGISRSVMIKRDRQMRFITAPDYISKVGGNYKVEQGTTDPSQIYRECSLLVLDDIGAQKDGDWQRQELFRLVNTRMGDGLITIYTANMPPEKLKADDRTIDRIIKTSVVIQMPEESIRRKEADREQTELLRQIGI